MNAGGENETTTDREVLFITRGELVSLAKQWQITARTLEDALLEARPGPKHQALRLAASAYKECSSDLFGLLIAHDCYEPQTSGAA